MRWFPLFLDLRGRSVVVVGGGPIAARKIDLFSAAGAAITVVAPTLTEGLGARVAAGELVHRARPFAAADVDGARVVVAATGDRTVNAAVAAAAGALGIAVNVVDDPELSTGILPAIVDRSPLVIAVSTEGTAPAFARHVRVRIEQAIDESYGQLARFLAAVRARIKASIPDLDRRRRFYAALLDGAVPHALRRQRPVDAQRAFERLLAAQPSSSGRVDLVGAGPGDPGLLTLNALRALQAADVVYYDRLVSAEILALARREAQLVPVGKTAGHHTVPQDVINDQLVAAARAGQHVVRLKGGDPFVFGRGGEEMERLAAAGIPYAVVPGVTAAVACGAYAGIPLTHREHARGVRFVTAHSRASADLVDWAGLAATRDTLALYMGVASVERIETELLRHGRDASTPVAFVENGTRADQRVVVGSLRGVAALATREQIRSPALLVVGAVAELALRHAWFGAPPVDGRVPEPTRERRRA